MSKKQWQAFTLAGLLALAVPLALAGCAKQPAASTPPSATPTQTEAPPTPTPEPTKTPSGNPLTGGEGDFTGQRPVAVQLRTGDGVAPQWGISRADVLIEGVTEGKNAALMAIFPSADAISKVGPVGPGRDLMLQFALPLNALPVHIDKNQYAENLLNLLSYQDLDGYHIGKAAFAFDGDRQASGYREENCFYTTPELLRAGLDSYGATTAGDTVRLFQFGERPIPAAQNATNLFITFSSEDTEELVYAADAGLYLKNNADGTPMMDADTGDQAAFANVFVLYASAGVKDDGITRQYDLAAGGTGLYLTGGAWQEIRWQKGDATAPLTLTDTAGQGLTVSVGKSFIAIYGGYYGQGLRLLAADGAEQALPAKPAQLPSGIPDEVAAAAEAEYNARQEAIAASEAALAAAESEAAAASEAGEAGEAGEGEAAPASEAAAGEAAASTEGQG
ncbi:MAG: DUF3048 C-terminal domain-containing protein [Gemmiger sp.]|nr:DUF3048 C-terminal domain-containing protein [Gemmiger sp.]